MYVERAPLSHVDQLSCPVLLLQGLEDQVVPPSQAELFAAALEKKGIPHAYLPFDGEQHGFRKQETVSRGAGGRAVLLRPGLRLRAAGCADAAANPWAGRLTAAARTPAAAGSSESSRSIRPPWPGSSVPMSLMPRSRLIIDSPRSPSVAVHDDGQPEQRALPPRAVEQQR